MLSISPAEVIITIVNFFLLYFVLKHFLYDPILRFTEDRKARIAAGLEEDARVKQALADSSAAAEAKRCRADAEAKRILSAAHSADLRYSGEEHRKAEDCASELRAEKMQAAQAANDAARESIQSQTDSYAETLLDKVLEE